MNIDKTHVERNRLFYTAMIADFQMKFIYMYMIIWHIVLLVVAVPLVLGVSSACGYV